MAPEQYYTAIRTQYRVVLHKVEAHVGIYGNELADSLAKAGVTSYGNLGRFQGPRTRPLNPPDIGFNQDDWKALGVEEQSRILSELLKSHLPAPSSSFPLRNFGSPREHSTSLPKCTPVRR